MTTSEAENYIEAQIGERIKSRRKVLGYSPQVFAKMIGVSYQQLHKYETGTNRVSSAQLATIAKLLHVDVNYFFQDSSHIMKKPHEVSPILAANLINEPDTIRLVKNYVSITDGRMRDALVELTTCITKYINKHDRR